ncbi:hypothetical protein LIER_34201 [Lithospermum erythrorhizon]|uniref:Retroviral polymerase SH3-like domain-containing protein n=1 Tax=Lithospermum erythrorhizon TaxID=34254 RepID=A0AAV3RYT6_LITER
MSANRMFTIKSEIKLSGKFDKNFLQTTSLNLSKLWHQIYGHLSHKSLQTQQTKYLIQGMPHFKIEDVILEHFRVWRCLAHAHVPKVGRSKLDKRSSVCILLGICQNTKGYRLFNVKTNRDVISTDVVFEEDKQWEWKKDFKEQIEEDLEWEKPNYMGDIAPVDYVGENQDDGNPECVDQANENQGENGITQDTPSRAQPAAPPQGRVHKQPV